MIIRIDFCRAYMCVVEFTNVPRGVLHFVRSGIWDTRQIYPGVTCVLSYLDLFSDAAAHEILLGFARSELVGEVKVWGIRQK